MTISMAITTGKIATNDDIMIIESLPPFPTRFDLRYQSAPEDREKKSRAKERMLMTMTMAITTTKIATSADVMIIGSLSLIPTRFNMGTPTVHALQNSCLWSVMTATPAVAYPTGMTSTVVLVT